MTPEQWKEVEQKLSYPYGFARLLADGHKITAEVQRGKGLRYCIAVFIDGKIDWAATREPEGEPHRKFWRLKRSYLYTAPERAQFAANAKKRCMPAHFKKRYAEMAESSFEMLDPSWPSAKLLCRHLRKTCTSVEMVEDWAAGED